MFEPLKQLVMSSKWKSAGILDVLKCMLKS